VLVSIDGIDWSGRRLLLMLLEMSSSTMSRSSGSAVAAEGGGGLAEDTNGPPVSNVHRVFPVSSSKATSLPSAKATRSWSGCLGVEVVSWPAVGAVVAMQDVVEVHRRSKTVKTIYMMCVDSLMVVEVLGMKT